MPRIIEYTENEGSAQTSASTLMQLINQSKNSTAGMVGFQVKTVVVSSLSGVIFGQASSMLVSSLLGPGMGFLVGAAFGFGGGIVHRWRTDVREAKEAFAEFPELMEHHWRQADPYSTKMMSFDQWRQGMQTDCVKQGYAIAALYSASPAIQRIREMREEELIAKYIAASSGDD